MNEAAQAFARALAEERRAALQADFDALLRVQEEKRALMESLRDGSIEAEFARELHEVAQQNIALIRHLVSCVKGYLGATAEPGYTARGEAAPTAVNHVRGRL
jgi:glucose-6-phosphate-specific signal transduction histidine kinase